MKYQFLPKHLNILHDHHLISWLVEHCILGVKRGAQWNYMGDRTIFAFMHCITISGIARHHFYPLRIVVHIRILAHKCNICAYMQYLRIYAIFAQIFDIGHWPCPCGKMRHWPSLIIMMITYIWLYINIILCIAFCYPAYCTRIALLALSVAIELVYSSTRVKSAKGKTVHAKTDYLFSVAKKRSGQRPFLDLSWHGSVSLSLIVYIMTHRMNFRFAWIR